MGPPIVKRLLHIFSVGIQFAAVLNVLRHRRQLHVFYLISILFYESLVL